jgi:formate hydrogenlyase transcriptional activator
LATEGNHGRREALRYRTLRQIADPLVVHREPRDLFRDLAGRLKKALSFNFINFVLHDPTTNTMRLHGWETTAGTKALHTVRWTVDDTTAGWVWQRQRPLFIPDVQAESRFPRALETLREHHVRTYLVLPMSTGSCKLGTIGIGCGEPGAYGPHDLDFVQAVAQFVIAAVEKALRTQQAERERDRLRLLLGLSNSLASNHTLEELFSAIASALRAVIPHDVTTLMLYNLPKDSMRVVTPIIPQPPIPRLLPTSRL